MVGNLVWTELNEKTVLGAHHKQLWAALQATQKLTVCTAASCNPWHILKGFKNNFSSSLHPNIWNRWAIWHGCCLSGKLCAYYFHSLFLFHMFVNALRHQQSQQHLAQWLWTRRGIVHSTKSHTAASEIWFWGVVFMLELSNWLCKPSDHPWLNNGSTICLCTHKKALSLLLANDRFNS